MINVGDLLAVLRLRDEMTPAVNNAVKSLGALPSSMNNVASAANTMTPAMNAAAAAVGGGGAGGVGGGGGGAAAGGLGGAAAMTSYQLTLLGRGMKEAGTLMTGAFTVPILGAAGAAIKFGGDFEQVTSKLVSLAGVSKEELDGVKKKILELAPATGIGAVALAEGMYAISSTVSDTNVALQILESSARLSASGLGKVDDIGRSVTTVINSYGAQNITAAKAADILTRAVRDGGAEAKALAPTLANVIPFAAKMGVSFEQVAANFVVVTKAGIPASEAITQLTSVMAAMTRETPRGEAALKSVGLSYAAVKKEIREDGLQAALMHLKDAFKDNDRGLFQVLGRLEAFKNLLAVTGEQAGTYAKEVERMGQAGGEADQAFAAATKNMKFMWEQVVVSLEGVAIELSETLLPIVKSFLEFLRDTFVPGLKFVVEVFGDLPRPVQLFGIAVLGLLATVGPLLIFFGQLVLAIGNLSRAFGVFSSATFMSKIVGFFTSSMWVVAAGWFLAIAAAIGAIWAAWQIGNTESVKNTIAEWALSSDALAASLARVALGMEKLTPEQAKAAVAATGAAENQKKHTDSLKGTLAELAKVIQPMSSHGKSAAELAKGLDSAEKATASLLERVRALTPEQEKAINYFRAHGLSVNKIAEETGIASDVISVFIKQMTSAGAVTRKAAADMKPFNDAMEELASAGEGWKGTLDTIDGGIKESVKYYLQAGISQGHLATAYGLTAVQVKAVAKEIQVETEATNKAATEAKKYADAMEELNSVGEDWTGTLDTIEGGMKEAVKYYLQGQVSQGALATAYGLTAAQVKAVAKELQVETTAATKAAAEHKKFEDAMTELDSAGVGWQGTLETINGEVVEAIKYYIRAGVSLGALATAYGLTDVQVKAVSESLKKQADTGGIALRILSSEFTKLAQIAGDSAGGILRSVGQIIVQLEAAHKSTQQIGGAEGNTSGEAIGGNFGLLSVVFSDVADNGQKAAAGIAAAAAIASGAIAVWDATASHATTAGNALGGMMAGAQAGAAFGPWGMAIGAAAGLVVGLIRGKPAWAKAAEEVGRDFGVKISDGLAKEIAKLAKSDFGGRRDAASIFSLSAIIKEAGGLSEANLPQMTARLHDVFSMVERGQFSIAQGAKVLDENWQAFVAAGTDANGRLSDSLIEIIRLNYEFGTSSKEIAKYMKDLGQSAADAAKTAFDAISSSNTLVSAEFRGTMDQLKDLGLAAAAMAEFVTKETKRAVGGLNASLKIGADALGIVNKKKEELGTLMADYADKVRRGFNEGSSEMDGLRDKIQALQAEIAKQGLLVDATVIRTQGAATAFGASIYATFNQMVASGMSAREALKALEPSIASLGTQLAATGFTGGAAFADIAAMAAIAANEIAGPTLTAVEGIDQVLIGLHNSGLLTQEMFTGLTSSVSDSFNALINQGFDGNRVMRLMQPTLQHVWELMEDFGYEVDDATLALIQQGKDAGLVGDAHRNAQDVAVTAMNAAAVAMQNVANVLERVFGGAGDDSEAFAARARAALGTIPTSITVEVRGVYIPPEIPDYEVPDIDLSGVVPMAEGGQGYVDKPTLFLAGEAGPEQFAFSGAGKQFSQTGNSRVGHDDEVHQELVGVRRELAESREDLKRLFRVLPNQLVAAMLTRG